MSEGMSMIYDTVDFFNSHKAPVTDRAGDRDCNNCIYHASGSCRKWNCEHISVKEAEEAVWRLKYIMEVLKKQGGAT